MRERKRSYGRPFSLRALREARRVQLLLGEAAAARGEQHAVPRARRVADAELAQDLLAQPPALQVLARLRRLLGLPQVALVVGGRARQQLEQPLAALAPLGLARVLLPRAELDRRSVRPAAPARP